MKKSIIIFIIIFLLSASCCYAREIKLHFPHFSGQNYDWKIFQSEKVITVRSGKIPSDGRLTLTMPDAYTDYIGMTRWMLKNGGGLDMIYVGSRFSVECLSDKPNADNIIYTDNPENDFLADNNRGQQTILDRLGAVNHLLKVYSPDDELYKAALKEQKSLNQRFEKAQADRFKSSFYAARFGEVVDFTRGVADKIYESKTDHIKYFNDFVTHTLNFEHLYTSGHWKQVLNNWLMMNIQSDQSEDGDQVFKKRLDTLISRLDQGKNLGAFAQTVIPFLVQKGKDELLPIIATYLNKHPDAIAALSDTTKQMLSAFKILTGKKAPDLIFKAPVRTQTGKSTTDIVLKSENLNAAYTIMLFYKGSCQLCEDALITLANRYKWLKEHNVRVIAVSGDETQQDFEKRLIYHQWPDNYCDFTGMDGVNFINYAVMGTPTLYLLDKKGIILKKSATANEIIDQIKKTK